jgi:glycosyltransferase involved in cell wall biosynthesis
MRELLSAGARRAKCLGWQAAGRFGVRSVAPPVSFVVERADWSIRWDGLYITNAVNASHSGSAGIVSDPSRLLDRVVHFGSQYMWTSWGPSMSRTNRFVVSFFHGKPDDGPDVARHVREFLGLLPRTHKVVTAASGMERRLLEWGVPREKLVRIPIGVDTSAFAFADATSRSAAKKRLGVPADRLCIGSFQKDGVGWGDGLEPKLIKGPDVFLEAVRLIARERPVFVLLTGPARGYLKTGLDRLGVPYRHVFLDDYLKIVECYHALDLYLMTSREEGGPKSIVESMSCGTPIVATRCGMAEDLLVDGANGALAPIGDGGAVAGRALDLLADPVRLDAILGRARIDVMACDWQTVGAAHWENVYAPLLLDMKK